MSTNMLIYIFVESFVGVFQANLSGAMAVCGAILNRVYVKTIVWEVLRIFGLGSMADFHPLD